MDERREEDANLHQAEPHPGEDGGEGVRWGFWWKVLLTVTLVVSSLISLYGEEMVDMAADHLVVRHDLEHCDIIFVPSGMMLTRLPFGVDLLKKGYGDRIVLTGESSPEYVKAGRRRYGFMDSEARARRILEVESVVPGMVRILPESNSSFTDCRLLFEYWRVEPFESVMVVTDPYHARRFDFIMRKVFEGTPVKIVSYPTFPGIRLKEFYLEKNDYYLGVLNEYVKSLAYWWEYR